MKPIIDSILDTDHYKMTMGQLVYRNFPRAKASYKFINRNNTDFPANFADKLHEQIKLLSEVKLDDRENTWLSKVHYLNKDYLRWLKDYQFNPDEVSIKQEGSHLEILIEGLWHRTIYWEVPLMALISELYFEGFAKNDNWKDAITDKFNKLETAGCTWSDFGTRRRFSKEVQHEVVFRGSQFKGFLGTSNQKFAQLYNVKPIGTYAHEGPMAMQTFVGVKNSNNYWLNFWKKEFKNNLSIVLPDTLTTKFFLKNIRGEFLDKFTGFRQDSGDPEEVCEMFLQKYEKCNINARLKTVVFSDSLDADKLIALHHKFSNRINVIGGIGTNLTNDVGAKPLNMVIKLDKINGEPVVKLSDTSGKYTGDKNRLESVLNEIR